MCRIKRRGIGAKQNSMVPQAFRVMILQTPAAQFAESEHNTRHRNAAVSPPFLRAFDLLTAQKCSQTHVIRDKIKAKTEILRMRRKEQAMAGFPPLPLPLTQRDTGAKDAFPPQRGQVGGQQKELFPRGRNRTVRERDAAHGTPDFLRLCKKLARRLLRRRIRQGKRLARLFQESDKMALSPVHRKNPSRLFHAKEPRPPAGKTCVAQRKIRMTAEKS